MPATPLKLGHSVCDRRNRSRWGMLCGFSGQNFALATVKRNGVVFRFGRKYLVRLTGENAISTEVVTDDTAEK